MSEALKKALALLLKDLLARRDDASWLTVAALTEDERFALWAALK